MTGLNLPDQEELEKPPKLMLEKLLDALDTEVADETAKWLFIMLVLLRAKGCEIPLEQLDAIPRHTAYLIDKSSDPIVFRIVPIGQTGAEVEPELRDL